jgi:hypothetical protein
MTKPKITRLVFTAGTTVTLPAPVGSRSSLDIALHAIEMQYHPVGVRVTKHDMHKAIVIPFAQITSIDEELTSDKEEVVEAEVKRGPGRPAKTVEGQAH